MLWNTCYMMLCNITGSALCIWTICELVIRGRKEYVSSIELLGVVKVVGNKSYIFNLH